VFCTRGIAPVPVAITRPRLELGVSLAYLAVFSVVVLGWELSSLQAHVPPGRSREVATLVLKLVTMCAVPALLCRSLGSRAVPAGSLRLHARLAIPAALFAVVLFAFQAAFGRGLRELSSLHAPATKILWCAPGAFVWLVVEAGLTEELLFRAFLQTRLATFLRSEAGAVLVAAVLFGLAHAPGLYLRGGHLAEGVAGAPTAAWAIADSLAIISPAGILFGVLWSRTRSFVLVVLLHGWADLLPNLAPFIRTWSG
jgi:membrane protease YdiL (CAAX protease family)